MKEKEKNGAKGGRENDGVSAVKKRTSSMQFAAERSDDEVRKRAHSPIVANSSLSQSSPSSTNATTILLGFTLSCFFLGASNAVHSMLAGHFSWYLLVATSKLETSSERTAQRLATEEMVEVV